MMKKIWMNIEIGEQDKMKVGSVITLKNNDEYAVAEILIYDFVEYLYLVNINNFRDIRFGVLDDEKVSFVSDHGLFEKLLIEIAKKHINQ